MLYRIFAVGSVLVHTSIWAFCGSSVFNTVAKLGYEITASVWYISHITALPKPLVLKSYATHAPDAAKMI